MLILTRKLGEGVVIGDDIKITIEKINKSQIKLSVNNSEGVINHIKE